MKTLDDDWPLLLKTGYGNIFKHGRWNYISTVLLASAINSGEESDWDQVSKWAQYTEWDEQSAC